MEVALPTTFIIGDKLMNWAGDLVTINKNSDGSLRYYLVCYNP